MRISSQQVFDSGVSAMQKHSADIVEAQRQISSLTRYHLASDNALAAGLGVQVSFDKAKFSMFKVNQDQINASLTSTDTQLNSINTMLQKFQQMMVQAGNDALGSDNRKLLGQQADSLLKTITQLSSATDANGQPILKTSTPPEVLVAPSVALGTGVSYAEVMTTGLDVLTFLGRVRDRLNLGTAPTAADFTDMKAASDQVTRAQVKTGLLQNQLDAAVESASVQSDNVEKQRSTLLDTDLAEASANLARSNALLQAAQSIMAKMDVNSLFTKL